MKRRLSFASIRKYFFHSFLWRWSFAAFILAVPTLHGQNFPYPPGNFDISITLGCDCSCCCDTNHPATNNPIGLFLSTNRITGVSASGDTGESDPEDALEDALKTFPADRILVFTHGGGEQRYREDVDAGSLERRFGIPVSQSTI